jgi:hypothetical protein
MAFFIARRVRIMEPPNQRFAYGFTIYDLLFTNSRLQGRLPALLLVQSRRTGEAK